MRSNSPKQSEASRRNGTASKGPKSVAGKQKVRQNAVKDAVYAKDVVVQEAGESLDDFNRFRDGLFKIFQPAPIAEIFFNDFVENWWRRQRVRRAEALSLRWESESLRNQLEKIDDIERCNSRFLDILVRMGVAEKVEPSTHWELEECRIRLSSSSLGLFRLQQAFRDVESKVVKTGKLTKQTLTVLVGCFGVASDFTTDCITVSGIEGTETLTGENLHAHKDSGVGLESETKDKRNLNRVPKVSARATQSESEEAKNMNKEIARANELLRMIRRGIEMLERKRHLLRRIEEREARAGKAAASVGTDAGSDRYSRAETMYERRMHRAFMLYVAAQKIAAPGMRVPELPADSSL